MKEETKEMLEIAAWKEKYNKVVGERNSLVLSNSSYKGENTKLRNRVKEQKEINEALCGQNKGLRRAIADLEEACKNYEAAYENTHKLLQDFLALPWYKKIFVK